MALLPNRITAARLALLPVLWLLALLGETELVGPGLLLVASTDVVDGIVARRTHTATRFGSAFDSVVDHLMTASTVLFLVLLRPEFVREQAVPLAAWAVFTAGVLATGWIRHRRLGNLHLYSAKAAGVAAYAFACALLVTGAYSPTVFAVVLALACVAEAETLAVLLVRREVDEHAGSVLLLRRRAGRPAREGDPRVGRGGDAGDGARPPRVLRAGASRRSRGDGVAAALAAAASALPADPHRVRRDAGERR
jgi:phosphatidylglycerophosphate synthase